MSFNWHWNQLAMYKWFLVAYLLEATGLPYNQLDRLHQKARTSAVSVQESILLLHRYGYMGLEGRGGNPIDISGARLPNSTDDRHTALLLPPQGYTKALEDFQRQYNLSITGQLDSSTAELLTAPRCGNPDTAFKSGGISSPRKPPNHYLLRVKRLSVGDDKVKWKKRLLTWKITSYPSSSLNNSRAHAVFQHAFNVWAKVANLEFKEQDYYKDADIVIKFGSGRHGDSIPFDGRGAVLAHAFYPPSDDVYSLSGDAHFDDDEEWHDGPHSEKHDLFTVAVHEFGHSLGLDHSSNQNAIMFPYYRSVWKRAELHQDDIRAIQALYGAAKPGKYIPPVPELPDIQPPPPRPTEPPSKDTLIDYCNTSIDAIIKIRNVELYLFKGSLQWRVTWSKTVTTWVSYQFRDGPAKIFYYWPALPKEVDRIDAGIERHDSAIYLFRDKRFWLLVDNMNIYPGFPATGLPLTALGLPDTLPKVDTVFRWAENQHVYIFATNLYWKLEESKGQFGMVAESPEYPRLISETWQGVPDSVDAAFTGLNGVTLFFIGRKYYAFNNVEMKTQEGYPKTATLGILGCLPQD